MKILIYSVVIVLLVPLQTTLLPHVSIWGLTPDVGLAVAALIGLFAGELEGLIVGLAIGWILNMYSAGDLWISLVTKGGVGLLAGLFGQHVAHVTPTVVSVGLLIVSTLGGAMVVLTMKSAIGIDTWWMVQSMVLPQACLDAVAGAGLFYVASQRLASDRVIVSDRL
ncbi:MAG TPA: hypothetical protein PKA61_11650 [Nitrospira sp.]|nr:hypothetical protein [Nitrospira sp.]